MIAAQRRHQRLANFKTLQDQLLRPPTLAGSEHTASNTGRLDYKLVDKQSQRRTSNTATDKSWSVEGEPAHKSRAQRAHALAAAAAREEGIKVWVEALLKITLKHADACYLGSISRMNSDNPVKNIRLLHMV